MSYKTKHVLLLGALLALLVANLPNILYILGMDWIVEKLLDDITDEELQDLPSLHPPVNESYDHLHKKAGPIYLDRENETRYPILLWWTPFTGHSRIIRECGMGMCLFTHSRTEFNNSLTEGFLFYGTALEWTDLPLPRQPHHLWSLLHEESPKNNWGFACKEGISLFNFTATPSRYSSYPLVTQWLTSIDALNRPLKYSTSEKSKGDLGLVMYLHSDCNTPSDRDSYTKELMNYVKIDSYGKCLNNKDLPENLRDPVTGMDADDLYDIIAQYKFTMAFENAICEDYITEKVWRPLEVGSVPIVKSSPSVSDWAPNEHSIILVDDFSSPKELAEYLLYLDQHDEEYEKYLEFKKTGVTNQRLLEHMKEREWKIDDHGSLNFIEGFECYVCDQVHKMKAQEREGLPVKSVVANTSHYKCNFPEPSIDITKFRSLRQEYPAKKTMDAWRHVAWCADDQTRGIHPAVVSGQPQLAINSILNNSCTDPRDDLRIKLNH